MSTFLKISLTLLGLVLALLLLLVVRVITLDPNDYRDWLSARFEEQTGRRLTLAGDIDLSIYPWAGLSVEDVTVDNAPGFGEAPLLRADRASVRVKLLPLLRERYEIDTVQLRGVSLNLAVNESGIANWQDLAGPGGEPPVEQGGGAGLPVTRLVIGGVDVQDVDIRYEDLQSERVYEVSDLVFNIGELVYGTPIDLAMTFNATSSEPELQADVQLNGTLNYDLDNGSYSLAPLRLSSRLSGATLPDGGSQVELATSVQVDLREDTLTLQELSLDGLGTSLTASGQGRAVSSERPVFEGDLSLSGADLAVLFRAAGVADLAERLASVNDRSFQVATSAVLTGGASSGVSIPVLQASLLGADLAGNLEITESGRGNPRAAGNLTASGPDLPLVVEVLGQASGGEQSMLVQVAREMRQVSNRTFDLRVEFDADTSTGIVSVPILEAQLVGASISGQLQGADVNSEAPHLSGILRASGPNLPLLLQIGARIQGGVGSPLFQMAEQLRTSVDGDFSVNGEFDADIAQGNIAVPSLTINALGFEISGELDANRMSERNGNLSGRLTVESSKPAPLVAAAGQAPLAEVLQRVSVNLALNGSRTSLAISPLRASITVAGPRIADSPVDLQLDAATRINLDQDSLSVDSFKLSGLGLDVEGAVEVERLRDDPFLRGNVELAAFNLRNFLRQLNQPLPATRDPGALQRVGLATRFEGSANRIALEGLSLALDGSSLLGNLTINSFTGPSAEFDIEIDRLNVDNYLAPVRDTATTASGSDADTTIPVEQLRGLTLLGEFRAGELTAGGLTLSNVDLTVNAADGELNLAPLAAELYQGSFAGAARLSVAGTRPEMSLEADLQRVDLEPLLLDLLDATYLSGQASVDLALTGSGASASAIKQTLNGSGRLAVEEGVLRGVDVTAVLRQLETMIRSRRAGDLQRGTSTAFDSFASTLTITDGVVRSNDMLIQSPGIRVTGNGTLVNLASNAIDFTLTTTVDGSTAAVAEQEFDIGGYSLPIACTGTLDQPRCLPDAGEILRARLQREVQNRVIDLLDRSLGVERDQSPAQTGATQATGASQPTTTGPDTSPQSQNQQPETQPQTDPPDLQEQLINRALERIFN